MFRNEAHPSFLGRRARAWITLAFAFIALAVPTALRFFGLTAYDPTVPPDYAPRVGDISAVERLCLVSGWMIYACLLVGAAALAQSEKTYDVGTAPPRAIPAVFGATGVGLIIYCWVHWSAEPYSGRPFELFQGWPFLIGWLLFWGAFAFWPERGRSRMALS
jgi:hypothetical protein